MPTVTVARNDPAGAGLRLLHLAETLPDHRRAGQCLSVALPGASPAYFALASVPGDPAQLLVKDQGDGERTVRRLSWRVGLSMALVLALWGGFHLGIIEPQGVNPVQYPSP